MHASRSSLHSILTYQAGVKGHRHVYGVSIQRMLQGSHDQNVALYNIIGLSNDPSSRLHLSSYANMDSALM